MSDDADGAGSDTSSSDNDLLPDPQGGAEEADETVAAPQGFGDRLADSFGALVAGLVLIPLACVGLFWNEGHAVRVARALDEVGHVVRSVPADRLDPASTGKPVHLAGETTSAKGVTDEALGVQARGLKLARHVEMYQWKEKESGSGNERKFTYTREWSDMPVSSSGFHAPGHANPVFPSYRSRDFGAADARIEAVPVGGRAVLRLGGAEDYAIAPDEAGLTAARRTAGRALQASGGGYYVGERPESPRVGDVRISYKLVPEGPASFIGRQEASGLEAYRASNGQEILLAYPGIHPADVVVAKGQDDNRIMTWVLRGLGMLVLLIGFIFLFAPVNLLTSYVPLVGSVVAGATFLVALVASLALGASVMAVAWLAYRPLLAGGVIAGAVLAVAALRQLRVRRRPAPAAFAPA